MKQVVDFFKEQKVLESYYSKNSNWQRKLLTAMYFDIFYEKLRKTFALNITIFYSKKK